ncbi:MAG: pre-peptidase C-terminal domain-containing protein [Verrucomicrobia bacterium]|nr:pre-peptidase C-terminal domain-containing protein [Verrucomicrobiota bacterium]
MLNVRALLLVVLAGPVAGFAQSPSLTHTSPGALMPGKAQELTVHGANLLGATNLWTGFGARILSANATNASAAKFQVSLPADTPVGIHAVRVASVNGGSSPLLLMVDDLPSVADKAANVRSTNAQPLAWPVAVDGAAASLGCKFYRVTVKAGDRLAIEVVAQRLGSKLDPVLRLLDLRGRELAFCDDESGLGGDCRLAHVFAAGGDHLIEVRDINFSGGGDYRFRLRVGDFPLASLPFPAAVKAGAQRTFDFVGPQVDKLKPVTATAPLDAMRLALSAKFPGGKSSTFVSALVSDTAEFADAEPNDSAETATSFTLPAGLNGRFLKPKDRDFWKFDARKGQRVLFTAQTRSIGSASEVMLQLRDAKGTAISSSSVNDAGEGSVTNTIPADGTYFLVVDELIRRGGPQHAYRIVAELLTPGFMLEADVDKVEAVPGGSFTVKVSVTRRDYTGPVTLSVLGIEGARLADEIIKEKATNGMLKVTLPESAAPGSLAHFRIIGSAKIGENEVRLVTRTTPALRRIFSPMLFPPRELDGFIALGVKVEK